MNSATASHPAYGESLARLRATGVRVSTRRPHPPASGGAAAGFRWEEALDLLAPGVS